MFNICDYFKVGVFLYLNALFFLVLFSSDSFDSLILSWKISYASNLAFWLFVRHRFWTLLESIRFTMIEAFRISLFLIVFVWITESRGLNFFFFYYLDWNIWKFFCFFCFSLSSLLKGSHRNSIVLVFLSNICSVSFSYRQCKRLIQRSRSENKTKKKIYSTVMGLLEWDCFNLFNFDCQIFCFFFFVFVCWIK